MTTTREILTPADVGDAVELSAGAGKWRKQILPMRRINYKGRVLNFNRTYLAQLRDSFKKRAFDQVPAQIADAANKHNNDPRNFGGELVDVELGNDGLYGVFEPSEEGAKILRANPKIGVSARILEGYERSDGQRFPKALQHVLLTVDPHVSGMKPWEQMAELSSDLTAEETLDLSGTEYEEENNMPKAVVTKTDDEDGGEVTLSREEYTALQELLKERQEVLEFTQNLDPADFEDEDDEEETEEEGDGTETEDGGSVRDAQLSATLDAQSAQILELTNQLREKDIQRELQQLADLGLAPAIIEASRPLLEAADSTVELSGGDTVDVGEATRNLLSTITQLAGNGEALVTLDNEIGLSNQTDPQRARDEALLNAWEESFPV